MAKSETGKGEQARESAPQFWILFVRGHRVDEWRPQGTARGGLDMQAYRSKSDAAPDLYQYRQLRGRGNAKLVKYVPEGAR